MFNMMDFALSMSNATPIIGDFVEVNDECCTKMMNFVLEMMNLLSYNHF